LTSSEQVEPDCALEVSIAKIELQMRTGNFVSVCERSPTETISAKFLRDGQAMVHCNQVSTELVRDRADSYHRVRLMILKAEVFAVSAAL
jgi:anaphase-promoting complex subunit 5